MPEQIETPSAPILTTTTSPHCAAHGPKTSHGPEKEPRGPEKEPRGPEKEPRGPEKEARSSKTVTPDRGFKRLEMLDNYIKGLKLSKKIHENVAAGRLYLVHRQLLCDANVDEVNNDGDSLLNVAINCGQLDVFHLLLKHGADPNIRSKLKKNSRSHENSPLWKTVKFRDLRWCKLLMEGGYDATKDREKDGWIDSMRKHLEDIEKKKKGEIDLTQDLFNVTNSNFLQWFDSEGRDIPFRFYNQCSTKIRKSLQQASASPSAAYNTSIYKQLEALPLPKIMRNSVLIQDNDTEDWLEDYKRNKARAFERMFVFYDECVAAERKDCGVNVSHGWDGICISHISTANSHHFKMCI